MSESAKTLFAARAMIWVCLKGKDEVSVAWWEEKAANIAAAILSTHAR